MSGRDLASVQGALAALLRAPTPLDRDASLSAEASAIAAGNERLSPAEQVDIYREQYFLRHVDSLRDDFRAIERLLGEDAFHALATAYLAAHPPSTWSLRDAGEALPRFVAEAAPWRDDPLVADLARAEWAFIEAFDGPDAPPLDAASVATVREEDWPRARLVVHPSVRLLALAYPSTDFRTAARKGEAPARPAPAPTHVVVYRGPDALLFLDVEPDAFALLSELAQGTPLGDACERAAAASGASASAFEAKLGEWFQRWTERGWIVRVDV